MTSFAGKTIASGVVVDFSDIIETENETWGRVSRIDRQYMAIRIGEDEYCAALQTLPDPQVIEKLITWARIQGFKP
jgi:hypothetical protein